ncbi:2-amino-4,5-dihydroxy-6-one-heptanoic acid-7-phosphate synthase, partial [Dactylosporangium sp. NPDC005572]|uniref:2-amino-4,5-dihydroxy-6-one-heptanoic acid-7-phosphate synthase n=1 Tax=Dactylosporangium sp. NPDC005572 TaxID=3156889 RepID=UPI00339FCF60
MAVVHDTFARRVRLQHLHRRDAAGLFVVPLDHSVTDGPIVRAGQLDRLIGQLADGGADAVVLHKGALRHVHSRWFRSMSLIVHLSASTTMAPDPDAKVLVCDVEEALRLGAHAVSVHVNLGAATEARQLEGLARVAGDCDRWGVPLLAMVYPRGPQIADGRAPELVAHATTLAADLGADLVKTSLPRSPAALAAIVAGDDAGRGAAAGERDRVA